MIIMQNIEVLILLIIISIQISFFNINKKTQVLNKKIPTYFFSFFSSAEIIINLFSIIAR